MMASGEDRLQLAQPVPYAAESVGSRVVVRFGRPIEAELGGVVRILGTYVRTGDIGADGRSVVLTTAGNLSVRAFDLGNAVVLDLMETAERQAAKPAAASASPTASPAPAASARPTAPGPRGGEALGVRIGEHEGYSRVVFDWPRSVDYSVDQGGGATTITFDQVASPDLGSLRARPPRFIEGAESSQDGGRLKVVLRTPGTPQIRHFRSGTKVVVDVLAPAAGTPPAGRPAAPPVVAESRPANAQPAAPSASPSQPVHLPAAGLPARGGALSPPPVAGRPMSLVPVAQTAPDASGEPVAEAVRPISVGQVTPPLAGPAEGLAGPAKAAPTAAPAGATTLRFDRDEPVAAAVFRRAAILWVVFDRPKRLDIPALRAAGGNLIRGMEQMDVEQGTVLRIDTVAGINPSMRRNGLTWLLDFVKQPLQPQTPIQALAQATPTAVRGSSFRFPSPAPRWRSAIRRWAIPSSSYRSFPWDTAWEFPTSIPNFGCCRPSKGWWSARPSIPCGSALCAKASS
jgi:hypothetical protein